MGVGDEREGDAPHPGVEEQRQDVAGARIAPAGRVAAGVDQRRGPVGETEHGRVALAHREEDHLQQPAPRGGPVPDGPGKEEGRRRAQRAGHPEPASGRQGRGPQPVAREQGQPAGGGDPRRRPGRGEGGVDRQERPGRRPAEPEQRAGGPGPGGRDQEGQGGQHGQRRAQRHPHGVGRDRQQGEAAEVEGDDGRGRHGGRGAGAGAGQDHLRGPPRKARAPPHRQRRPQARGQQAQPQHRGEGELEGRVEERAGIGRQDGERAERQGAERGPLASQERAQEGGAGGDRGADHRHVGPGGHGVEDGRGKGRRRRPSARVDPRGHRIPPVPEPPEEAEQAEGHHRQVEAAHREQVGEPAPSEGLPHGGIDPAGVAGAERPHQGRLGGRKGALSRGAEAAARRLDPRRPTGGGDPHRRLAGAPLERDAPGPGQPRTVATAGVARPRRRPEVGHQAHPIPPAQRPCRLGGRQRQESAVDVSQQEPDAIAHSRRDRDHLSLDRRAGDPRSVVLGGVSRSGDGEGSGSESRAQEGQRREGG